MLVNGKWMADWQPVQAKDAKGGFVRQTSSPNWVTPDGSPGSYRGRRVQGGSRTLPTRCGPELPLGRASLIARKLKELEMSEQEGKAVGADTHAAAPSRKIHGRQKPRHRGGEFT